jgi:hypothetical protein
MARTLRPLSLGGLLDETFNIYRRNFLLFVGISAIPNLVLLLLQLLLEGSGLGGARLNSVLSVLAWLTSTLASLFATSVVTAATTLGVSDIYLEIPTSIVSCFSRIAPKALKVLYVSFIVGLIVGLGTLLCIIPGILWAGTYGIAVPAVVLENITGSESLTRSRQLTESSVGRVIVVYFLTTIFAAVMVLALSEGAELLGSTVFHGRAVLSGKMFQEILASFGEILFGPVTAIALTLVYYDQRVRKEAFDIDHMMSLISAQNIASAGASSG